MQVKIIQNNSALNRSANSFRFRLILEPALSLCLGCLVVQLRFSESLARLPRGPVTTRVSPIRGSANGRCAPRCQSKNSQTVPAQKVIEALYLGRPCRPVALVGDGYLASPPSLPPSSDFCAASQPSTLRAFGPGRIAPHASTPDRSGTDSRKSAS